MTSTLKLSKAELLTRLNTQLTNHLTDPAVPAILQKAMQHSVLNGGKRIRPLLVYTTGTCFGATVESLDSAALSVELLHCYSLVHDDLPAMDNDTLRRGQPTTHVAFNEATAILAGDALLTKSFEVLSEPNRLLSSTTQLHLLKILSSAAGARGMIGGQSLDITSTNQSLSIGELEKIHTLKTGALIRASVLLGAEVAGVDKSTLNCLDQFAKSIGIAFQFKDDLLDQESDTLNLGKTAGLDKTNKKASAKISSPDLHKKLNTLLLEAKKALSPLSEETAGLVELAEYIIYRKK